MKKYSIIIISLLCLTYVTVNAQGQKYFPPKDSLVIKKLQQWSDYKFGLLMHWGTYSHWGIVESWSLCPEDEGWCQRRGEYAVNYFEYKKQYENLQTTFNPKKFNPEKWAAAAADAGMKYVVFTTKHHDGFCMFDTKQTDYKITSDKCPFSKNPGADVTKEIFNAFRARNLWVGTYFSKPDWHCENYWMPYFPPLDRNPNYDIKKHPEKWELYKKFTRNQIEELMTNYGRVDILWLDGGWVHPNNKEEQEAMRIKNNQDIDMNSIAKMARNHQPGLIVVDRDVLGENQNYLTPEQQLPDSLLPYPWETCMTMATSWSWVKNDKYKSSMQLIQLLAKIVSRGGNFLLNIAPDANGEWDSTAYDRLKKIGAWMKINSSAIYNTHPVAPYQSGNCVFTQNGNCVYAIYLKSKEDEKLPDEIMLPVLSKKIKRVSVLGNKDLIISNSITNNLLQLKILHPEKINKSDAWVIKVEM